jgi:branched-chain amino acid transport system ATP-binding protein
MSASPLLQARGLHKRFGGLAAIDGVDIAVTQGELHALIGPNGAGKSTLAALLAGALQADAGDILLAGRSVSAAATHQRVALGLARSFQITSIFPQLSALDNVTLAVQASGARHLSLWRARSRSACSRAAMPAASRPARTSATRGGTPSARRAAQARTRARAGHRRARIVIG